MTFEVSQVTTYPGVGSDMLRGGRSLTGVWRICSMFPKFSSMTVSCIGCTTGLLNPALGLEFCRGKCCVDWRSCDRISSRWRAQGPVAPLQPQKLAMGKLYGFGVELPGM
jgi:hypothetical protein